MAEMIDPPQPEFSDDVHLVAKTLAGFVIPSGSEIFERLVPSSYGVRLENWRRDVGTAIYILQANDENIVTRLHDDEEFQSLLFTATVNAYKTHKKEKHEYLRNGLINSARKKHDFDASQVYLNFIDALTLTQIVLLEFLNKYPNPPKPYASYAELYGWVTLGEESLKSIDVITFRYAIKDLDAKGLLFVSKDIEEIADQVYTATGIVMEQQKDYLPLVKITDFGLNFLKFIEEHKI